ncbi:EP300-interacting inhibitor of differentiation 3-like [Ischnura elegans]|uniref:EP300-interacting inhibitor of differentiation 3-like n=1 Tax=Ischnura elegans TaxID=197161 RepID=UPI001ED8A390|nr:EP300-interacting inhibitor of differentiation 3-like [Ischnura elegans]
MSVERDEESLLSNYQELLARVEEIRKEDMGLEAVMKISGAMDDVEKLIENVSKPREIGLDARVLELSSAVVQQNAEMMDTVFRPMEFADKLVNMLGSAGLESSQSEASIWSRFSEEFGYLLPLRPSFDYINGTYDREGFKPKERAPRNYQRRKDTPKEIVKSLSQKENEKNETAMSQQKILDRIRKKLSTLYQSSGKKAISYFECILNPNSFEETCQNILNVAFLVRDSWVKMYMENDELLMVPMKSKGDNMGELQKEELKRQFLIQMSRNDWKALVEAYQITEPMISFGLASDSGNDAGRSGCS